MGILGEFRDSRIQTSRFESRILESTIIRFESHESNGKLITIHDFICLDTIFTFEKLKHGKILKAKIGFHSDSIEEHIGQGRPLTLENQGATLHRDLFSHIKDILS